MSSENKLPEKKAKGLGGIVVDTAHRARSAFRKSPKTYIGIGAAWAVLAGGFMVASVSNAPERLGARDGNSSSEWSDGAHGGGPLARIEDPADAARMQVYKVGAAPEGSASVSSSFNGEYMPFLMSDAGELVEGANEGAKLSKGDAEKDKMAQMDGLETESAEATRMALAAKKLDVGKTGSDRDENTAAKPTLKIGANPMGALEGGKESAFKEGLRAFSGKAGSMASSAMAGFKKFTDFGGATQRGKDERLTEVNGTPDESGDKKGRSKRGQGSASGEDPREQAPLALAKMEETGPSDFTKGKMSQGVNTGGFYGEGTSALKEGTEDKGPGANATQNTNGGPGGGEAGDDAAEAKAEAPGPAAFAGAVAEEVGEVQPVEEVPLPRTPFEPMTSRGMMNDAARACGTKVPCKVRYMGGTAYDMIGCPNGYRDVRTNRPIYGQSVCLECRTGACNYWTPTGDPYQPYLSFDSGECRNQDGTRAGWDRFRTNRPHQGSYDCYRGIQLRPDPNIDMGDASVNCPGFDQEAVMGACVKKCAAGQQRMGFACVTINTCTAMETCPKLPCGEGNRNTWDAGNKKWECDAVARRPCSTNYYNKWNPTGETWYCAGKPPKPACTGRTAVWDDSTQWQCPDQNVICNEGELPAAGGKFCTQAPGIPCMPGTVKTWNKGIGWSCEKPACTYVTCPKAGCSESYLNTWDGKKWGCTYMAKPSNCSLFNPAKWMGSNTGWVCSPLICTSSASCPKKNCDAGEVSQWKPGWLNIGGEWTCAAVTKPICPFGSPAWSGGKWVCPAGPVKPPPPPVYGPQPCTKSTCPKTSCSQPYKQYWTGSKWSCQAVSSPKCGTLESPKWVGGETGYVCQAILCYSSTTCPKVSCNEPYLATWGGILGGKWKCVQASKPKCETYGKLVWNSNSGYSCKNPPKPNCGAGTALTWNGSSYYCKNTCTSYATCPKKTCPTGQMQLWNGAPTGWSCKTAPKPACKTSYVQKWGGQAVGWTCQYQAKKFCIWPWKATWYDQVTGWKCKL